MPKPNADDVALAVTAGAAAACAAGALACPKYWQDLHFTDKPGRNDTSTRWFGLALADGAAQTAAVIRSDDTATKKRALKVAGGCWLTAAAYFGVTTAQKHEKRNLGIGNAVAAAGLGTYALVQGFRKEKAKTAKK